MDLVDIDQVLDNLELREAADERQKAAEALAAQSGNAAKALNDTNGPAAKVALAPAPAPPPSATSSGSKSFVGVSQVFNSLDDYCRNVESLGTASLKEYDEECHAIEAGGGFGPPPPTAAADDDGYDDDEVCNDIQKFVEKSRCPLAGSSTNGICKQSCDKDNDSSESLSDSITTSSPSTFSSGPSPGLVSTTDDQVTTPMSPLDDEELRPLHSNHAEDNEDEEDAEEQEEPRRREDSNEEMKITEKQAKVAEEEGDSEGITHPRSDDEDPSQTNTELSANPAEPGSSAVLEDLANGLSSISITTGNSHLNLPGEASVSSALGNVLEDLSETTSSSQVSQQRDGDSQAVVTEVSTSLLSTSPQYKPYLKGDEDGALNARPTGQLATVPYPVVAPATEDLEPAEPQKPITFGSTMDEISDTELDSMLQEMDVDEVASTPRSLSAPQPEETTAVKSNDREDAGDEPPSEEFPEDCSDCLNADSFSQASTVEFSEIRAAAQLAAVAASVASQTPPGEDDLAVSSNSAVSSYTSSESSLDADYSGNYADAVDGEGGSQARPQRPTSLDLPALKMRYANAGQTPPGAVVNGGEERTEEGVAGVTQPPAAPGEEEPPLEPAPQGGGGGESEAAPPYEIEEASGHGDPHANLGKVPPIWVPDNMAPGCMQCHSKFTMIKRRHHCRACGKVLCSVCCSQKFKLEFLANPESRVCVQCYLILTQRQEQAASSPARGSVAAAGSSVEVGNAAAAADAAGSGPLTRSPNPNNPMEYCSTIPPHRQVSSTATQPPSVIVPVGVLKKEGSYSSTSSNSSGKKGRKRKSVMFSDGIAPGSDLATMEFNQWAEAKQARRGQQAANKAAAAAGASSSGSGGNKAATPTRSSSRSSVADSSAMDLVSSLFRGTLPPIQAAAVLAAAAGGHSGAASSSPAKAKAVEPAVATNQAAEVSAAQQQQQRSKRLPPSGCDEFGSFIPDGKDALPPLYVTDDTGSDYDYKEVANNYELVERLQRETLKFAVQNNFYIFVKIVNLKCCMNRTVINFTTCGMHHVGNDEIIILLEYNPPAAKEDLREPPIPKDIFTHLLDIYREADHGNPIAELSYTSPRQSNFLGSHEYGGFIFIRPTFQCLQDVIVPDNPYLIGILIHRSEVPWAKIFPLRLMLRLGAQYRYYPCPHISIRSRESVYAEIAQTIINFLADFRNYSYSLPSIRGMVIHMEDRQTTVLIPRNRGDDVIKAINNSSDHILAFGGNFSKTADGHLVCMQNVNDDKTEMYSYSTQAINIQGQPRRVTGASFFVLNEALKSSSGLSGKCSIVEDGLMVQILPTKMEEVRNALRNQKDIDIVCGPLNAEEHLTEVVSIKWVENDRDFNVGVKSPIDDKLMDGIASMRVHANFNYANTNYSIRLTDIFIIKFDDWYNESLTSMSVDITRISEQIAKSASLALVPFLGLLAANKSRKIGLRATLNQDNVCYEAGTRGSKLPPLYMNALDNHLVPVLHNESNGIEETIILELIFYILNM